MYNQMVWSTKMNMRMTKTVKKFLNNLLICICQVFSKLEPVDVVIFISAFRKCKEIFSKGLIGFKTFYSNSYLGAIMLGLDKVIDMLGLGINTKENVFHLDLTVNRGKFNILDLSTFHVLGYIPFIVVAFFVESKHLGRGNAVIIFFNVIAYINFLVFRNNGIDLFTVKDLGGTHQVEHVLISIYTYIAFSFLAYFFRKVFKVIIKIYHHIIIGLHLGRYLV